MKIGLLEAARNEKAMKEVLAGMMSRVGSEFCAFFTDIGGPCLHVLLDGRELSARIPEIREKVHGAFRMFANLEGVPRASRERVYYRSRKNNLSYLVGLRRIESYFMVPVLFDSQVRGVLYFGSVREDAFVRETIAFFDSMSREDDSPSRLHYMLRGETTVLEGVLDRLPCGAALVSPGGELAYSNSSFAEVLGALGGVPGSLREIGRLTGFNLSGIHEEYLLTGEVLQRRLVSVRDENRCLSIDVVDMGGISPDVSSMILVRDRSSESEARRRSEERLAITAHELRTPLTGLKNSLGLIRETTARREDGEACVSYMMTTPGERFLDTALRTVERLGALVDGIVETSPTRPDHGHPESERIATESILRESCRIFEGSFARKEIRVHLDIGDGAESFTGDPGMTCQIVQNIVSNSIKHVPAGGRIRISVSTVDGRGPQAPRHYIRGIIRDAAFLRFRFVDDGPGIPGDIADWVNSPPGLLTASKRGFKGFGLYISGKLVEAQGGSMTVHSRTGRGGVVDIILPADSYTGKALRSTAEAAASFESLLDRGMLPVVGVLKKEEDGCWLRIMAEQGLQPSLCPPAGSVAAGELCIWPVSEGIAICIFARPDGSIGSPVDIEEVISNTGTACQGGTTGGFAEYSRDGRNFAELVEKSVESVTAAMVINR